MAALAFEALRDEYAALWASMEARPGWRERASEAAAKLLLHRGRYRAVAAETGVPWWLVAVIHQMEASASFDCHLHNGDPLDARTVSEPRGRPDGDPPFAWEASAADALRYDGLDRIDWTTSPLERALHTLEIVYNGSGYRRYHPDVLTPYLWSGTLHYTRGKYVADGKWSAAAVSAQVGAALLLQALASRDAEVADAIGRSAPQRWAWAEEEPPADSVSGPPALPPARVDVTRGELVAQGSRSLSMLGWIRRGLATLFGGGLVSTQIAPYWDAGKQVLNDLRSLGDLFALGLIAIVGGLLVAVYLAEHYQLEAARSGRYVTRKGAGEGS